MRTMYIILSWVGWAWFAVAGTAVVVLVRRRPAPRPTPGTEAETVHEQ